MARPPKDDDDRGECVIKFRCTRRVRNSLEANAKAAGRSLSAFLRHIGEHGYIVSMDVAGAALDEAQRQGNNLNQLTRVANIDHEIRSVARAIEEMKAVYRASWEALIDILSGKRRH